MSKIVISNPATVAPLLNSMTRDELRAVATSLNVPRGKNAKDTITNLMKAVAANKVQVKMDCTISFKPADGSKGRVTYFGKTLRTYVSGPGLGNFTYITPANPVEGSPAAPHSYTS